MTADRVVAEKPAKAASSSVAIVHAIVVTLAAALAIGLFFRTQILTGFALLFGDRYDGIIAISIIQHWFDVFRGLARWNVTGYFYPYKDTLGYNDGYLIYGVIYSVLETFGIDPFLGSSLTNVVVRGIGFYSFFYLCRRAMNFDFWPSLAGAVLFTIANNSFVQGGHVQLFSVSFAPSMALLIYEACIALAGGRRAQGIVWGLAAGFFYSCWLLTSFYMAWFFGLFALSMAATALVFAGAGGRTAVLQVARQEYFPLGLIALGSALGVLPFLSVYLPIAAQTGMHSFGDVMNYSPSLLDVVNVGPANLIYGPADKMLNHWLRPGFPLYGERTTGFPLLFLALFMVETVVAWRNRRDVQSVPVAVFACATLVLWLFVLHVRSNTAWHLIYDFVPGAKAIRVISRLLIFLSFPMSVVVAAGLKSIKRRVPTLLVAVIYGALVLEQVNLAGVTDLDRNIEVRFLHALPTPPRECAAFYAATEQPPLLGGPVLVGLYSGNVPAMLVATYLNIPTINGISTFNPPDWDFGYPERPDFLSRVRAYAEKHHISGLCGLNLRTNTWLSPVRIKLMK